MSSTPFPDDPYNYGLCALVTVGMQLAFFAVAYGCKFDLVTDFAGSTNFVLLALLTLGLAGDYGARAVAITVLLVVSRLYLAFFLLFRVCTRKKDARFDEVRDNFFIFLGFWVFQMFWAFVCTMPVIYINMRGAAADTALGALDYLGWVVFAIGILLQIVADVQKFFFRRNPDNKGKFCNVGLWQWSRHPNYFGEMLVWIGAFVAVIPCLPAADTATAGELAAGILTALSPIFTIVLLVFGSGMPTAEGANLGRYYKAGRGDEWEAYAARTSPVILLPNCLYAALPGALKAACCCELPFLKYAPKSGESIATPLASDRTANPAAVGSAKPGDDAV